MEVRAKVTHIQPGTLVYRVEGEEFPHEGKLYEHVEPAETGSDKGRKKPAVEEE